MSKKAFVTEQERNAARVMKADLIKVLKELSGRSERYKDLSEEEIRRVKYFKRGLISFKEIDLTDAFYFAHIQPRWYHDRYFNNNIIKPAYVSVKGSLRSTVRECEEEFMRINFPYPQFLPFKRGSPTLRNLTGAFGLYCNIYTIASKVSINIDRRYWKPYSRIPAAMFDGRA